ncbi:hypothetical protein HY624_03770 [Candidatus Uhrbacteria bacterium]|nr:hypothetical protein [Candidatus Uhrbacteria bacterium]
MRLSSLQKFILTECYTRKGRVTKKILLHFYDRQHERPKDKDQLDTVTKSVESLIDHGLMVGYGVRTPKKWYIEEVRLMPKGRSIARKLLGEQQELPLKS